MLIRPARQSDATELARFLFMAESEMAHYFFGTTDQDEERALAALRGLILNPAKNRYSLENTLTVELEGKPVGGAVAFPAESQPELDRVILAMLASHGRKLDRLVSEGEPGTYYLSTMGVDPACRGKGVGSRLMAAMEERGAALGFSRASLLVSTDKPRVQALYERLGYAVLKEVPIADLKYFRMVKTLSPQ